MRSPSGTTEHVELLTKSRQTFEKACQLFPLPIEPIRIPMGKHTLPGYFIWSGKAASPTIIGINGGDSTNEEMVHLLGFAARERGWNCLVFEGPGQYTAKLMNPDLVLMPEWEIPTGAVIDWLFTRSEVDKNRIALFGWSLSSNLAIRAAALDKRVKAVISNGLIVDVYQAWYGVWPKWLQRAKPKNFDRIFRLFERLSSQVRSLTNIFYAMHGVETPSAMIQAWKEFNVGPLASQLNCPILFVTGEAEYAEQSAGPLFVTVGKFLRDLKAPAWLHEFGFESGWAASHCQIGAQSALQELVFDWLEAVEVTTDSPSTDSSPYHDFSRISHYTRQLPELTELLFSVKVRVF